MNLNKIALKTTATASCCLGMFGLFNSAQAASMAPIEISPAADGFITKPANGTSFDTVDTVAESLNTEGGVDFLFDVNRTAVEFALPSGIDVGTIDSVELSLTSSVAIFTPFPPIPSTPPNTIVNGYVGNGIIEVADANEINQIGTFPLNDGPLTLDVTSYVTSLLQSNENFAGFMLNTQGEGATDGTTQHIFRSTRFSDSALHPSLTITFEDEPIVVTPEPSTVVATALVLGLGLFSKNKKSQ